MTKSSKKFIKPVLNNDRPDTPFQYDVKGSVERSKRVRYSQVFDTSKKKDKDIKKSKYKIKKKLR